MKKILQFSFMVIAAGSLLLQSCSKSGSGNTGGGGSNTAPDAKYTKKVLVEDHTGTWCGFCPAMADPLDAKSRTTPNMILVGLHNAAGRSDPYHSPHSVTLANSFSIPGFPTAVINRKTLADQTNVISFIDNNLGFKAHTGLKISSTIGAGNTLNVTCNVGFSDNYTNALRVVCLLVEDSLRYAQTNYAAGGPNPIPNYLHRNVLRDVGAGNPLGENLGGASTKNNVVTHNYTFNTTGYNVNHLRIIALVTDATSRLMYNAQIAKAGTTQEFD